MKKMYILGLAVLLTAGTVMFSAEPAETKIDAAKIYEGKCGMCHGAKGDGNAGMPAVKGTEMTAEKLTAIIFKGDPGSNIHKNPIGDLTEEQAKAVAEYIKKME